MTITATGSACNPSKDTSRRLKAEARAMKGLKAGRITEVHDSVRSGQASATAAASASQRPA